MSLSPLDRPVKALLREAAEWRLLGLLFECPSQDWREELAVLAKEAGDAALAEAVELALRQGDSQPYHTVFGPGGPAPPREVSYRRAVHSGRVLAEICAVYEAFGYVPRVEEPCDHVAAETGFVAYLRLKEAFAASCGDGGRAAVCRAAADRFAEEHLAVIAQPLAGCLEALGIDYLALAAAALAERVGPPPGGSAAEAAVDESMQSGPVSGQRQPFCGNGET